MRVDDLKINGQLSDNDFLNQIIAASEENGIQRDQFVEAVTFDDDPNDKVYLILLSLYPDSTDDITDSYRDWTIKIGRQETYDYLKLMIKNELIDPNTSFVIAGGKEETVSNFKENFKPETSPITVFRFMKVMYTNHKVLDDGESFDIDEYSSYDYENGDESILNL